MTTVGTREMNVDRDAPRLLTFPPVIPLATIALAEFLHWVCPLNVFSRVHAGLRIAVGGALCAAGLTLVLGGIHALRSHRTAINPSYPTRTLVTRGVFGVTRHPLYVGGSLVMLAGMLAPSLAWLSVLCFPSLLLLHFGVVLPEEAYLERRFGDLYLRYRARVPRYLIALTSP